MISIFLEDDDKEYTEKLKNWLSVHPEVNVNYQDCRLADKMRAISLNCTTIRLISSKQWLERKTYDADEKLIVLDDGAMQNLISTSIATELPPVIKKYAPLSKIFNEIHDVAVSKKWIYLGISINRKCPFILVIHISGATHRQPAAQVLAALSAQDDKTLLLNIDPASDLDRWFPNSSGEGMSRLAYLLKKGALGSIDIFTEYSYKDYASGVHLFRSPWMPEDSLSFNADSIEAVSSLAAQKYYKLMVIDAGMGLTGRNLSLIPLASKVIFICNLDMYGVERANFARELLDRPGIENTIGTGHKTKQFWLHIKSSDDTGNQPGNHDLYQYRQQKDGVITPQAYKNGFPKDAWEIAPEFCDCISSILNGGDP